MHKLKSCHIKLNEKSRLYELSKPIIALTGSIATGKSTVSNILRQHDFQVIDADKLIKDIYTQNESLKLIQSLAPSAIQNESIDFKILRESFFNDPKLKSSLENYLYQKLPAAFKTAANKLDFSKADFIIYDVPLFFEKNLSSKIDNHILSYTPKDLQISRLCQRDKITEDLAQKIISSQIDIEAKKAQSKLIVDNSKDLDHLESEVENLIHELTE